MTRGRARVAAPWLSVGLVLAACDAGGPSTSPGSTSTVVMVAAGDISCDPDDEHFNNGSGAKRQCREKDTAELAQAQHPDVVAVLGDQQYDSGEPDAFAKSYDLTWGKLKSITRPTPGNHEYMTPDAAGYFSYFGAAAGKRGEGWYSYDIGAWHVVVLNANCGYVSCKAGSPQMNWLAADLAAHPKGCLLAYWHQPLWSHGKYPGDQQVLPMMQALYEARADLVLNGHDHSYQRFEPRRPDGTEASDGVREIVVGTGGRSHYELAPNRQGAVTDNTTYGVLRLTMRPTGYDWQFLPTAGGSFTDSGTGTCHRV